MKASPVLTEQSSRPGEMVRYPYMEWAYAYGYSKKYASSGWASYERHFARWAESQGYAFDVITDPAARTQVAQMNPIQLMRYILPLICALCMIASLPGLAIAHDDGHILVPSSGCIQTILDKDTAVGSDDCLVALDSFPSRDGRSQDGHPYPTADLQTERYSMTIHYTGGAFPDASLRNWPLSIDLNFGGSGWFSYLLVMVETRAGKIASGFVQQAGDRCNDGYARWNRFSENGNGIYTRSATPSRLVKSSGRDKLAGCGHPRCCSKTRMRPPAERKC